ncbi:MAG: hypothetical protein ACKO5Q_07695, partial [Microcystaceae cyanobacterium]
MPNAEPVTEAVAPQVLPINPETLPLNPGEGETASLHPLFRPETLEQLTQALLQEIQGQDLAGLATQSTPTTLASPAIPALPTLTPPREL